MKLSRRTCSSRSMLEVAANAVVLVIAARVLVDVLRGALFLFASGKTSRSAATTSSSLRDEDAREAPAPAGRTRRGRRHGGRRRRPPPEGRYSSKNARTAQRRRPNARHVK